MEEYVQRLTDVLQQALNGTDTKHIHEATEILRKSYYNDSQSVPAFVHILSLHTDPAVRQFAAVELRKLIPPFWQKLSSQETEEIRHSLLDRILREDKGIVKHNAARVISAIAKIDLPLNAWSTLPTFLEQAAVSSNASDREVAIYVLYTLIESMDSGILTKTNDLLTLFSRSIRDPESNEVRNNTMMALEEISQFLDSDDKTSVRLFQQIIPSMMEFLKDQINAGDDTSRSFETFNTLLVVDPAVVSRNLGDLLHFMSDIASTNTLEQEARISALNFLITCARFKKAKIQSLKLGEHLVSIALKIATEEISDDLDEELPSRLALRLIDALSTSLPPSHAVLPLLRAFPQYLASQNPALRRAALLAVGVSVEGSPEFISTQLGSFLPQLLGRLSDDDDTVRKAALQALAYLADELPSELSKQHADIVPIVFHFIETDGMNVAKAACNCLDALLEGLDKSDIIYYLPQLTAKLFQLLQETGDIELKSVIISAIGSAAHAAEEGFAPYYKVFMHLLGQYVKLEGDEETLDLRGVAIDTAGVVATAVGKEAFYPYVQPLVEAAQEGFALKSNRLRECAFVFFAVCAKVYGEDFAPFLQLIVPVLHETLQQEEVISTEEVDETEFADIDSEPDVFANLTFNSAITMEKEVAADALGELCANLGRPFLPYLSRSIELLIPLTLHNFDGCRKTAFGSLWRSAAMVYKLSEPPAWQPGLPANFPFQADVENVMKVVRDATMTVLDDEEESANNRSVLADIFGNIAETVKLCGPATLAGDLGRVCDQVLLCLQHKHRCQIDDFADENENTNEMQEESAELDTILTDAASEVIVAVAAALGSDFHDAFVTFLPFIMRHCSGSMASERASGIGTLAEVTQAMKSAITPFTPRLLPMMIKRLSDESVNVKGNAAYATGVLCLHSSTDDVLAEYPTILRKLQPLLLLQEDQVIANACGCVARMTLRDPQRIPLSQVLPLLVAKLPLHDYFEEHEPIAQMLIAQMQANNDFLLGNTDGVIRILDAMLGEGREEISDATCAQIKEVVHTLAQQSPELLLSIRNS